MAETPDPEAAGWGLPPGAASGPPAGGGPYGAAPGYGVAPGYGQPPWPSGPWAQGGSPGAGWWGPPGKVRSTGISILLFFCTFGIYGFVYNYSVHDEMKRHSGRGIGGGVALLLTFLAGVAMPFVTSAEVGAQYTYRGWREPVRGWTGLWAVLPAICGYILLLVAGFATVSRVGVQTGTSAALTSHAAISLGVAFVIYLAAILTGGLIWFVKTNDALNRYWESLARSA
jgi:hypothetical protein